MTTQTGPERTIGQLVADATHDVQGIVRSEIALAKAEVSSGAKVMGKGAGLLGGAAFVGLLGLVFLFHTLARVLDIWLPISASYAIVTLLLFVVAAVLGLLGKKALDKAKPAPSRAIAEAKQTVATLKS
jgi:protein-S-isoprenylcysteine O-methyltransferase Ste14